MKRHLATRALIVNLVGVGLAMAASFASAAPTADVVEGRLKGRVVDPEGQPIEGAEVRVMIGKGFDAADDSRLRTGTSGPEGRYQVDVPWGHAVNLSLGAPAGFYQKTWVYMFATSRQTPVHELDFTLERGTPLSVALDGLDAGESVYLFREKPEPFTYIRNLGGDASTRVTLPPDGGKSTLSILSKGYIPIAQATIDAEAGFRPDAVRDVSSQNGQANHVVVDDEGRKATIEGATVTVADGQLMLHPGKVTSETLRTLQFTGRVVDENDQPLGGAEIRLGVAAVTGGGNSTFDTARSAADGSFALEAKVSPQVAKYFLIVTRDGTAGQLTKQEFIPKDTEAIDVPPIKLAAGHSLKLRVVGPEGEPLEGAWVEAGDAYLSWANFVRTDAQGRVTVRNLPEGVVHVAARYGDWSIDTKLVVVDDPAAAEKETALMLKLPVAAAALALPKGARPQAIPDPPPLGSPAPELTVAAWSDSRVRKLVEYRGKVVVLEFWGTWCSACMNSIGASKLVAAKYAHNPDVVILGIHSAGTDMSQIRALQQLKEWDLPTGLDRGDEPVAGPTARAYGAQGWPTVVVIDRQGKIAYNSNLEKWNPVTIALEIARVDKALGLPPEDRKATDEEKIARMNQENAFRVSEQIDRALAPSEAQP